MEEEFRQQILQLHTGDKKSVLFEKDQYFSLLQELKDASSAKTKTPRQYYIVRKYDILVCGNTEKLIRKRKDVADDAVYFVHNDEIFEIIKRTHVSTGHGGRDKMMKVMSQKYANITREAVELFKSLCAECMKKRKRSAIKGVVVRPILTNDYGSRGQVDLIDMQSLPNGLHKWILVYQVGYCTVSNTFLYTVHLLITVLLLRTTPPSVV